MRADIYDGEEVTLNELHEILNALDDYTVLVVMFPDQNGSEDLGEGQGD